LQLFSFGDYGLALAALALMVFGAIECPPFFLQGAYSSVFRALSSSCLAFRFAEPVAAYFSAAATAKKLTYQEVPTAE